MTLSNPGNDSPLSYGILAYGSSATELPFGSTFSGNDISYVSGAAISLGSYTYGTTITGNYLHDIIPVEILGDQISVGVQSEFAGDLNVSGNTFGNLFIGTSLLASEGSISGNTYNNVASLHTSTYPSYVIFNEEIAWWQVFSTVNYLDQDILLISYASTLEFAIFAADDGSTITASDGTEIVQDCIGDWAGTATVDECGVCGGSGIAEGSCDCDGNVDLGCGCGEAGPSGCDETCDSTLEFDGCGVCDGDNSPNTGTCDCAGIPNGDVVLDGLPPKSCTNC
jgi:hypothetical protein